MSQFVSGDSLTPSTLNQRLLSAVSSAGISTNTLTPESGNTITVQGVTFAGQVVSSNTVQANSGSTVSIGPSVSIPSNLSVLGSVSGATLTAATLTAIGDAGHTSSLYFKDASGTLFGTILANSGGISLAPAGAFATIWAPVSGALIAPDGASTSPSLTFNSENSLGFYRSGASALALSYGTLTVPNLAATGDVLATSATEAVTTLQVRSTNAGGGGARLRALQTSSATGYALAASQADSAEIDIYALGSQFGGTTYGGVSGSTQAVIEATAASSFYIGTGSQFPIYLAHSRVIIATVNASGLTVAGSVQASRYVSSTTLNASGTTASITTQGQMYFSILSNTTNGAEFGIRSGNTVWRFASVGVG
jgi:hypothetical protein